VGEVDPRVKNDEEDERDDGRGEAGCVKSAGESRREPRKLSAASQRAGEARRARREGRAQRACGVA
jgi:hypothetical protein